MPRGRNYYDPILQVPGKTESETDYSRIELFPVGQESTSRLPDQIGKWVARKIRADGSIEAESAGSFDHDDALAQAQNLWGHELTVYELNAEIEDSTWDGAGPSPRIWQRSVSQVGEVPSGAFWDGVNEAQIPSAVEEEPVQLRVMPITQTGNYVLLDDICVLLESWAVSYETDKNPSAAMALRDAVEMLKAVG